MHRAGTTLWNICLTGSSRYVLVTPGPPTATEQHCWQHCMHPASPSDVQQMPAKHSNLVAYIGTATDCLRKWARANLEPWDALTDANALIFQTLLAESLPEGHGHVVHVLPLSKFKAVFNDHLTERRWEQFLKWFERELSSDLARSCERRAEPMLYPARQSDGRGGRGASRQSTYFLSFDAPPQRRRPFDKNSSEPVPVEQQLKTPTPVEASNRIEARASSRNCEESCANFQPGRSRQTNRSQSNVVLLISASTNSSSGNSIVWIFATALLLIIASTSVQVGSLLLDEILRLVAAAQGAFSVTLIV